VSAKNTYSRRLSRRALLSRALPLTALPCLAAVNPSRSAAQSVSPEFSSIALSPQDDQFLEELERANFQFFWEQADPQTGLVKDRCNVRTTDTSKAASVAATGFGLTALCIAHQRDYLSLRDARDRVLVTLRCLYDRMPNHRGFFYHFADMQTGARIWDSEVSSIDTAILLCGVLTCRAHFRHSEISVLASDIFNRVEWTWLSEDTTLLTHGWSPETGFLPYRWDLYSELMMMYLLGIGSARHPLPPQTWTAWGRTTFEYEGLRYIGSFAPLFIHQYSQAWFDFRGKRDRYVDYFKNSIVATEVHRRFCIELGKRFPDYSDNLWGITSSDSMYGYVAWGGPPEIGPVDGTVVPSAPAGSLAFMPQATLRVLRYIKDRYGSRAWCRYGFINALNPLKNWFDPDVVGLDTGITMLMAENLRTGFVWNTFMQNPEAQRALDRAGFSAI
jgi:hypothetical protein